MNVRESRPRSHLSASRMTSRTLCGLFYRAVPMEVPLVPDVPAVFTRRDLLGTSESVASSLAWNRNSDDFRARPLSATAAFSITCAS